MKKTQDVDFHDCLRYFRLFSKPRARLGRAVMFSHTSELRLDGVSPYQNSRTQSHSVKPNQEPPVSKYLISMIVSVSSCMDTSCSGNRRAPNYDPKPGCDKSQFNGPNRRLSHPIAPYRSLKNFCAGCASARDSPASGCGGRFQIGEDDNAGAGLQKAQDLDADLLADHALPVVDDDHRAVVEVSSIPHSAHRLFQPIVCNGR